MNVSAQDLLPLTLDLALLAGILVVFVADLISVGGSGRRLGYLAAAVIASVLVGSFRVDASGVAFSGAYVGDAWALFLKRVFLVSGLLAVLGSLDHVDRHHPGREGEYYLLVMFSLLGMTLLPGVRDLILLIVCFELMGLPLFVLAAFAKTEDKSGTERFAPEAGLKLYLVGVASTAITMFGLSLLYGLSGSTSLERLAATPPSPLLVVAGLMVLSGMAFKIGAVPFHMWVPDTYQGSGTPFVAFLSVAPKLAGFTALAAIFLRALPSTAHSREPVLLAVCATSIVVGNLLALVQTNVKRLLAYSGIGHIGFMLLAFASGQDGTQMLLFYAVAYVVTNMGAFQVVELVEEQVGDTSLTAFNGLARRAPALAFAMLLFLLSLAGIPFVVGFWAKLNVFMTAWQAGLYWLVIVGAVLTVVGLFYYLQVARAMYMMPPPEEAAPKAAPRAALNLSIAVCLAGVVALGAWPSPLLEQARKAARAFYAHDNVAAAPAPTAPVAQR
ncbi:MAG: NADH-quinone oxidoreductase subunit N [Myxococcales bacterium]|nr:NADH-quinone oxidoreductase subunit N [Myxococcales bacterium]MCB9581084.1 NADH-quinone oxidoreductase subunit N [Polyangiaceae bacterium]